MRSTYSTPVAIDRAKKFKESQVATVIFKVNEITPTQINKFVKKVVKNTNNLCPWCYANVMPL